MAKVVVEFPASNERKFHSALLALKDGRAAQALQEARGLIDAGYLHAYTLAGAICEKGGHDLQRNLEHALFYYQKAVDEVGAVEAWLALGRIHYFGKGVDADHQKSLYYYSTVYDETKSGIAAMMLARLYSEGTGVRLDRKRAFELLREAIEKGFALASTQLAEMELREGQYGKAFVHWLQGIWRAFRLPRSDTRLRPY
jgi:TPR repeat protein